MNRENKNVKIAAATVLGVSVLMTSLAQAALLNSYDFDGGLADTLGNGLDLVASGGTVADGRYSFTINQGLRLESALPSTANYAIEIRLTVDDSVSGFNKLIDLQDLGSDNGLYVYNGDLRFYNYSNQAGSVVVGAETTVGLARFGSTLEVYQDGSPLFAVNDTQGHGISAANVLNFFEDDTATSQGEAFAGSVDFIRIHDDASTFGTTPVPLPAAVWLFGSALFGAGVFARRKTRS
jgi:hypothetical protein